MKRKCIIAVYALVLAGFVMGISKAEALPYIEVEGFVDLSHAVITETGDITTFSEITYEFYVIDTAEGAEMDWLRLEFENDVFASIGTLSVIDPGDWSVSTDIQVGSAYEIASAGTTIGKGESLAFTLTDVELYTIALTDVTLWQEGQIWGQSWTTMSISSSAWPSTIVSDGGSTTPVPEPGTLFLLGTSLGGLLFYRKKKDCKI